MAYSDQALLSQDVDFRMRVSACAAVETPMADGVAPTTWAADNIWFIAAAPSFADKYASALAAGTPRPGWDEAVISDADIRAAVQAHGAAP